MKDDEFDPLSPEESDAALEPGADLGAKKAKPRDQRPFVRWSYDAPRLSSTTFKGKPPAATYLYRDAGTAPSLYVERFEWRDPESKGGKSKLFRQHSLRQGDSGPEWVAEGFPDGEPTPLFNLPDIVANPNKLVVLVEGEKAAAAAFCIFGFDAVPTTAPMGSNSFHRADVTPLAGRPVLVWRDNDASGERHLRAVLAALSKICKILVVDVAALVQINGGSRGITHNPDGWDAADAVLEWENLGALRAKVLELARPYQADETCTDNTTVPGGDGADQEKIRDELLDRIEALNGTDEGAVRAIVADAVKAKLSELTVETLIKPLAKKLRFTEARARRFWKNFEKEIKSAEEELQAKRREASSREEKEAKVREEAR
jgi:hypothetical protein